MFASVTFIVIAPVYWNGIYVYISITICLYISPSSLKEPFPCRFKVLFLTQIVILLLSNYSIILHLILNHEDKLLVNSINKHYFTMRVIVS